MLDEAAIARGENRITFLWDMEKFYDNICIERLVREAERLRYPMLVFKLGLMMHMARRWLRTYNYVPGCFVLPRNGIIAGCSQSTTFARILLYGMLKFLWDGYQTSQAYGLSYCPAGEDTASVSSFADD